MKKPWRQPPILLIQPRWLSDEQAASQWRQLRAKQPQARSIILAAAPLEDCEWWPLPSPGDKRAVLRLLWRLRRPFAAAIVLTDPARAEAGYGESKMWALCAKARRRVLNHQKTLRWREELWDKVPLGLSSLLLRALLATARRDKTPARRFEREVWRNHARRSLENFVALRQREQRSTPDAADRFLEAACDESLFDSEGRGA